jgi:signal transduction histidine kinase
VGVLVPTRWLLLSMIVAVAAIGVLAFLNERRRSEAELADLAREQAAVAEAAAPRLAAGTLGDLDKPGRTRVIVIPPGGTPQLLDGTPVALPEVAAAAARGARTARIDCSHAAQLGLPERTAMVGLAHTDSGATVAIASTAADQRDRDAAGQQRLVGAILLAVGLVSAFGGLALARQRRQLVLERELAVADAARARDSELERLSRAATMAALGSGVGHELSTPLGVIVGRAEQLLSRAGGDERVAKNAQAILDEAEHIDKVVRGLLGLARGAPIAMQEAKPHVLVAEATALVEHRFARAGVTLVPEAAPELPAVRCEPLLFKHALVNLLLNACEASPRGATVHLGVRTTGGTVSFVVDDDGQGITPEHAARATEPFFTTKGDGTGLGLAIANEIVTTHRGSLHIAPRTPRGTQVTITLPGGAHA